ncbi:Helicase conserved C-terminal domain-containing protein [Prevotellaceae bacterium HUN156]|nr:Helicase conserved C-terminal domain-containing protein [Prevotellaceae bacterium HUN156]
MSKITRYHAKYYAALLTQQQANGDLNSLSQSLLSSTVDINPHQIDAALFAFSSPLSKGVVLADEVGLGKTIEAGLVICQYWATGKRKILIVCPASLRKQWEAELLDKFGIPSEILDTKNYNTYQREGKNPLSPKRAIICSYNFVAKQKEHILLHAFDLAVIDEAHKMRNVYRSSARTSAEVRDALTGVRKLLLTATPFQNSLMELYGLTSIIDDRLFGSEKSFRKQYGKGENLKELRQRIQKLYTRTLRRDVREYINYTNRLPLTQKFKATDEEQTLYQEISDFLRRTDIYSVPAAQRKLTTMIVRKILASSTYALIFTLEHIKERLERMLKNEKQERFDVDDLVEDDEDWSLEEYDELPEDEDEFFDAEEIDIPRLKVEIATISGFIEKAKSIKTESKAKALTKALEEAFKKLAEQGAERKALIFTESTRTQTFLKEYLEAHGYAGRIVLFNGKASEPQTNEIYKKWCLEHPDKVSGIKAADRRAAAVDYFQHEADIMIATEAAAEGLNLQFCSLVINYDLPWNPQRIEQRIGRCHRYGQKYDVVVVNFLNMRNYADVRVFNLLSTKFKLFDDVFGASDEVLGQADTLDIESRIWEIYQQCRSEEEINQAFEQLQNEMQEQIDERMTEVRSQVLENFDINVQEHLRMTKDTTGTFLNRYEHIFWELTKYMLSKEAVFNDEQHTFVLRTSVAGQRTGKYAMLKNTEDAIPYRLSCPLAQHVINSALSLSLSNNAEIIFDQQALPMNANLPDYLNGSDGYLVLASLGVSALSDEQYLLFNAFQNDGKQLSQEDCEKLFLNGGSEAQSDTIADDIRQRLQGDVAQHSTAKLKEIDARNLKFIQQEESRIYAWEHDVIDGIEDEITTLKKNILVAERDARNAQSVAEKLELEKKVEDMKRKRRRLRNELEDREEEVSQQRKRMITELEQRMVKATETQNLFVIKFKVK